MVFHTRMRSKKYKRQQLRPDDDDYFLKKRKKVVPKKELLLNKGKIVRRSRYPRDNASRRLRKHKECTVQAKTGDGPMKPQMYGRPQIFNPYRGFNPQQMPPYDVQQPAMGGWPNMACTPMMPGGFPQRMGYHGTMPPQMYGGPQISNPYMYNQQVFSLQQMPPYAVQQQPGTRGWSNMARTPMMPGGYFQFLMGDPGVMPPQMVSQGVQQARPGGPGPGRVQVAQPRPNMNPPVSRPVQPQAALQPQPPRPTPTRQKASDLNTPLTSEMLDSANPSQQKQMIGERIFPKIQHREPKLAGKITGMLLEMDKKELLHLLQDESALLSKVNEALAVLFCHAQNEAEAAE